METLQKVRAALVVAWSFVDGFVEDHPRWSLGAFAVVWVATIWLMKG